VIELEPKIVVILTGTNDIAGSRGSISLETTLGYLKSMADLARSYDIQPVLCTVLPAAKYPWSAETQPNLEIPKLNGLLRTFEDTAAIPMVSFYSVMTDGNEGMRTAFSDDGVHPNSLGYSVMERRLKAALKQKPHLV
jgi:lysophospholipase L1-like esterase